MADILFNIQFDSRTTGPQLFFFSMKAEKYSISWHSNEETWELSASKAFFVELDYNVSCPIAWPVCCYERSCIVEAWKLQNSQSTN